MDRPIRRVVDDDRLAGRWLRHVSSEYIWYAPVRLPPATEGRPCTLGLAQMELRTLEGALATGGRPSRRVIRRWRFDRVGQRDTGELDRPSLTFVHPLGYVERLLRERGIRLVDGDRAPRRPPAQ